MSTVNTNTDYIIYLNTLVWYLSTHPLDFCYSLSLEKKKEDIPQQWRAVRKSSVWACQLFDFLFILYIKDRWWIEESDCILWSECSWGNVRFCKVFCRIKMCWFIGSLLSDVAEIGSQWSEEIISIMCQMFCFKEKNCSDWIVEDMIRLQYSILDEINV